MTTVNAAYNLFFLKLIKNTKNTAAPLEAEKASEPAQCR